MLKIILAEDHSIVRNGIAALLNAEESFEVVGEATNGAEVLELVGNQNEVDLILTDINMPQMDGIELIKEIKRIRPEIYIVVLSMLDADKYITEAFQEGADGYLLKNVNADEMIFAIKQVSLGYRYLYSELGIKLLERLIDYTTCNDSLIMDSIDLSTRELEVLNLIADGYTNFEMSEKLFLSKRTIEGHRQSLIDKTGSRNSAALIKFAVVNGLVL